MNNNHHPYRMYVIIVKKILGVILIIVGIAGLFLPFLQGIALILGGVFLIGGKPAVKKCTTIIRDIKNWFVEKYSR